MPLIFKGPGPFHLSPPQRALAEGNPPNSVTMTLYSPVDERVETITTEMTVEVARELAIRLWLAADEVEFQPRG